MRSQEGPLDSSRAASSRVTGLKQKGEEMRRVSSRRATRRTQRGGSQSHNRLGPVRARDGLDLVGRELDMDARRKVLEVTDRCRADDRGRNARLGEDPGEGDLGHRDASGLGDGGDS
jgi:hypothetical protein